MDFDIINITMHKRTGMYIIFLMCNIYRVSLCSLIKLINHDIQLILLIFGLINFLIGYYDASKNAYANIE